jgi:hypothetical protein
MSGRIFAGILLIGLLSAASPAAAQDRRSRAERVADEIAREVEDAANAVGTVTESVYRSYDSLRFRGRERFAVDRCVPYAERYGRMRVDQVRRYSRRSWRVYGTLEAGSNGDGWRRGYGPRAFTCTVRDDGRVKFKTRRLRRY